METTKTINVNSTPIESNTSQTRTGNSTVKVSELDTGTFDPNSEDGYLHYVKNNTSYKIRGKDIADTITSMVSSLNISSNCLDYKQAEVRTLYLAGSTQYLVDETLAKDSILFIPKGTKTKHFKIDNKEFLFALSGENIKISSFPTIDLEDWVGFPLMKNTPIYIENGTSDQGCSRFNVVIIPYAQSSNSIEIQTQLETLQQNLNELRNKVNSGISSTIPDYINQIYITGSNISFYAPFNGILHLYDSQTCKKGGLPMDRYMHVDTTVYTSNEAAISYKWIEIQKGEKLTVNSCNNPMSLIPYINEEIDPNSALIMEVQTTPAELTAKIQAATDNGTSPFYQNQEKGISVEQMGVYGSKNNSLPSRSKIATSADWTLITDQNESEEFNYYALYCPIASASSYYCWCRMFDPKTGDAAGTQNQVQITDVSFGSGSLKTSGILIRDVNFISTYEGYKNADKLKLTFVCIKLLND